MMDNYEGFKAAYFTMIKKFLDYPPDQAGSNIYASKLADLEDAHPVWADRANDEMIDA